MNLTNMLMNSMGSESSVEALSEKTGASTKDASSFISSALPMLMGALTQNASTQDGASSLANALTQHTNTSSMADQIANADENDGSAIIQHIFGDNSTQAVNTISQDTGIGGGQVSSMLSNIAPALLSGLSAATGSAQSSQQESGGFDFSGLLGMFGGGNTQQSSGGSTGTTLMNSLLGMLK